MVEGSIDVETAMPAKSAKLPKVSVIIPTHDSRPNWIEQAREQRQQVQEADCILR